MVTYRRYLILLCLSFLLLTSSTLAHGGREVGDYTLTVGWRNEPAYVGLPNGLEVHISAESADRLRGVEVSLQVEITFGPASTIVNLRPDSDHENNYIADVIPTRPGDYTFRVFGAIGDIEVDETFSASSGDFHSIAPIADITFPDETPSLLELFERITALEAQLAELAGE